MSISRAEITHDTADEIGTCPNCGEDTSLHRLYVECGDLSGFTPWLCNGCLSSPSTLRVPLEGPPPGKLPRPPNRRMRAASKRQEESVARALHGRTQKASGACVGNKGDVRVPDVLRGEMKCTTKRSFVVKRDVLDKIRSECVGREKPFVHIRFLNPLTLATDDEWVCIPFEHWEYMNAASDNS